MTRNTLFLWSVIGAIAAMDGSETITVGGHRVYHRPDLAARRAHWPELAGVSELSESVVAARLGGESFDEVVHAVLEKLLEEPRGLLTLLTGEDPPSLEALLSELETEHPELELDVHQGGQPHYPLLLAAE